MAKMILDKAGAEYEVVDATKEVELSKKFGVLKAPTMFVNEKGKQLRLDNVSDIKKFVETIA